MTNVQGAYCATLDMRTGDLPAPSYMTKDQYVLNAAEEIETALGHLYVTPFEIDEQAPVNRPTILFLKKLNWLLASGRFILDVAAAGEDATLNAYGKAMLDEAKAMLKPVASGDVVLAGAEKLNTGEQSGFTGPVIYNEDSESLVKAFYTNRRPYSGLGEPLPVAFPPQVVPYE